jgi:serine/threonine-protein kinase
MSALGRVLGGRYQLGELVGQGGMATIYRATDSQLGREVAVKVLRGEYGFDAAFVARFQREARAAAQLNHPNIVSVFDYATDTVGPHIVMELVTGGDLAAVLRERGPLPPPAAARIGQQIADALDAAHARGIVHRDIKSSNVLLTSGGRVKVADFGIAQAFSDAQLTMTGVTMGSVHYFSPEQARGGMVTTASDVYSAGLVMYEMLTGQRPFTGDSAAAVAMARLSNQVPSPMAARPDVPMPLDAIVRWALQPDPRARPTAAELSAALGRFLTDPTGTSGHATAQWAALDQPSGLYAPPPAEQESARSGAWGWLAALSALFVLVTAGVLVFLIITWGAGTEAAPTVPPSTTPAQAVATPFGVPTFEGMRWNRAQQLARSVGLIPKRVDEQTNAVDQGTVLAQRPDAGEAVLPGDTVTLTVAVPSTNVVVPTVRGLSERRANDALAEAGLRRGTTFRVYHDTIREGLVVRTAPRAGEEAARGTPVDLYLSRGRRTAGPTPTARVTDAPPISDTPEPPVRTPRPSRRPAPTGPPTTVTVGSYVCLELDTARSRIHSRDLAVGDIEPAGYLDSWTVVEQQPPAGAQVPSGTTVDLTLSESGSC